MNFVLLFIIKQLNHLLVNYNGTTIAKYSNFKNADCWSLILDITLGSFRNVRMVSVNVLSTEIFLQSTHIVVPASTTIHQHLMGLHVNVQNVV